MFIEIMVRVDGEEKYIDSRKFFDYMIKEYSKVKYDGKKIDPYPDRVNKFYDSIPQELSTMWKKAYPNVDISSECRKSRAWLLSNTNKAKKDFKGFTNRWLAKACQNGGYIPIKMEHDIEREVTKHKEYMEQAEQISATPEERKEEIRKIQEMLRNKTRKNNG